jgi:glycosyltransferase involved in cell wall biosynthesis
MKIVHITPGSGGSFYCENCLRDEAMVRQLRAEGHDVVLVPLYLPLSMERRQTTAGTPVFYGAINVYLTQILPWYRRLPRVLTRWLDSNTLLRWAARRAGSTRAAGLEHLTLSMLRGPDGRQARELADLVQWLDSEGHPDVVHLSNALLLGLAEPIRSALRTRVVCTLQDEDQWVDRLPGDYPSRVWDLMAEKAAGVDRFISVSETYAERMAATLRLPETRFRVVHPGIDMHGRVPVPLLSAPPVIGFLSRLSPELGLGILADAFLLLKRKPGYERVRLRAAGGMTSDDRPFVSSLMERFRAAGVSSDVEVSASYDPRERVSFLCSLSVLSVPVPAGEAFGMFIIEALSVGVPVVQPSVGAFPEILAKTGGGVLYEPNTAEALADALTSLLGEPARMRELGQAGYESVTARFDLKTAAAELLLAYSEVIDAGN